MKTNRATQNDRLEPKVRSRLRIAKSHLNRNTPDGAAKAHPRILPTRISRFDDAMSSHSVISSSSEAISNDQRLGQHHSNSTAKVATKHRRLIWPRIIQPLGMLLSPVRKNSVPIAAEGKRVI